MKIFYGENDINYNCPNNYAFLNWRFDDSMGMNDKNNPIQSISDNFEMGKAYLSNAILVLYTILHDKNQLHTADSLIFPILFNVWHGLELWLKSSTEALFMTTGNQLKKNHNIYEYTKNIKEELGKLGMHNTAEVALSEMTQLVDEFARVDANFDFARYSFNGKGDYQFYNAPLGDEKQWQKDVLHIQEAVVPNTAVDLWVLMESLVDIIENLRCFVEYLLLSISYGEKISDENYSRYLSIYEGFKDISNDKAKNDTKDELKWILDFVYFHIL